MKEILAYHSTFSDDEKRLCEALFRTIQSCLSDAEAKVWHAHPVWFLAGNPIVGYSKLKGCIRLLFWSGQSFPVLGLAPEGKFKAAEKRYAAFSDFNQEQLLHWLEHARDIQWDYKNIVKRKGRLERLS